MSLNKWINTSCTTKFCVSCFCPNCVRFLSANVHFFSFLGNRLPPGQCTYGYHKILNFVIKIRVFVHRQYQALADRVFRSKLNTYLSIHITKLLFCHILSSRLDLLVIIESAMESEKTGWKTFYDIQYLPPLKVVIAHLEHQNVVPRVERTIT